ncbi:hypothetical protein BC332_17755 [Capsicum chinense]|nr:hypothetical protein BC332_17755 [Capsicum chinense]
MEGLCSTKSDVFSFGVLLLEIVSRRKNNGRLSEHGQSLLNFAWKLWREGRGLELMDPCLSQSCVTTEITKCIHLGLLCVQQYPADRPTMSSVVFVLENDPYTLPQPSQPAFSIGRIVIRSAQPPSDDQLCSVNEVAFEGEEPDEVHGVFLCRGDVAPKDCQNCIDIASEQILRNTQNVSRPEQFKGISGAMLDNLTTQATSVYPNLKYAANSDEVTPFQKFYGVVQCLPDLSAADCRTCLDSARSVIVTLVSDARVPSGCRVLYASCNLRYELYQFLNPGGWRPGAPLPSTIQGNVDEGGYCEAKSPKEREHLRKE